MAFKKNRAVGLLLAAGALFHVGLIVYGYVTTGEVCPVCCKFAAVGVLLSAFYWLMPEKDRKPLPVLMILIMPAFLVVLAVSAALTLQGGINASEDEPSTVGLQSAPVHVVQAAEIPRTDETDETDICAFQVTTKDGSQVCLDIKERPAFIFAVWCPHCSDGLREITKLPPEKRPYIVVTYLRDGDMEKAADKLAENGLAGEEYYIMQKPPDGLERVPVVAVWGGETIEYRAIDYFSMR